MIMDSTFHFKFKLFPRSSDCFFALFFQLSFHFVESLPSKSEFVLEIARLSKTWWSLSLPVNYEWIESMELQKFFFSILKLTGNTVDFVECFSHPNHPLYLLVQAV